MDGLRLRKAVRAIVIGVTCFGLIYYGLEGTSGVLAGLLVFIGGIAICVWWAKLWPDPKV